MARQAIDLVATLDPCGCPMIVVVPEYVLETIEERQELERLTSKRPLLDIVTSMVVERKNIAYSINGGKATPIYKKLRSERTSLYDGDESEANLRAFGNQQPGRPYLVTICMDRERIGEHLAEVPPIWLIPSCDQREDPILSPPNGYSGHIFFANSARKVKRSSYYQRIVQPFNTTQMPTMMAVDSAGIAIVDITEATEGSGVRLR